MDPRVYLAIDNCFAIKRWTEPSEWFRVINDMGIHYIECVTDIDNEPLLMDPAYKRDWADKVNNLQVKTNSKVIMLYSGNSTYDTTGLAHPDSRVRSFLINKWFNSFIDMAAAIGADIGYFVHGIPENILFDREAYKSIYDSVIQCIVDINIMARDKGINKVALEQMYTPHQPPYTIQGMKSLMEYVYSASKKELYLTEDVGHHCPDYLKPTEKQVLDAFRRYKTDGYIQVWLGSKKSIELFKHAEENKNGDISKDTLKAIMHDIDSYSHMFASEDDIDCYRWLEEIGCYSPIIHLQQTDGTFSAHRPFIPEYNKEGKIHPIKLLRALQKSYEKFDNPRIGQKVDDIYLTFELYTATKEIGYQALYNCAYSVDYWREYIPEDGMLLSSIMDNLEGYVDNFT